MSDEMIGLESATLSETILWMARRAKYNGLKTISPATAIGWMLHLREPRECTYSQVTRAFKTLGNQGKLKRIITTEWGFLDEWEYVEWSL